MFLAVLVELHAESKTATANAGMARQMYLKIG